MKKYFICLVAMFFIAGMTMVMVPTANAVELYPSVVGNDVHVPNFGCSDVIPGYKSVKPVFAACDLNKWFLKPVSPAVMAATEMRQVGDHWIARGLAGHKFTPCQLDKNGKPIWAKLEDAYPLTSKFINYSGPGPCYLLMK